jgi:hypothetical protein
MRRGSPPGLRGTTSRFAAIGRSRTVGISARGAC